MAPIIGRAERLRRYSDPAPQGSKMTGALPLSDVVVLDLSDDALALGPRLLADLGARVVRVEPLDGDPLRHRPPFVEGVPGIERSLAHVRYNAGKESLALALDRDEGWELVDRLAGAADVVVAPMTKTPRAKAFFQEDRFAAAHPDVGLVDIVFRRDAPDEQATDLIGVAAGGLLYCHGYLDQAPDHIAGDAGFKQAAFNAAATVVALVIQGRQRGRGSRVTISLQEAATSTTIQADNQNYRPWGLPDVRWRVRDRSTVHRTADGFLVAVAPNPVAADTISIWFEEATGRPCPHPIEFQHATGQSGVRDAVAELTAVQPRDWLIRRGQELRHFVTPVQSASDIAADDHLQARGYFPEVPHPALGRALRLPRSPFRSSTYEPRAAPPPQLGEHSALVLQELLGIPASEVAALRARSLVGGADEPAARAPTEPASRSAPRAPAPPPIGPLQRGDLPLAGVRVLDFCWMAAGPLVTELLANLGADVVKVESATGIDRVRSSTPAPANPSLDHSAFFNDCNTDKRSITLDLRRPEATELILEMAPHFDLVTSNFTPGTMEKWGLGYEALRAVRPDIIVATYSAMGESGPHRGWKAIGNGVVGMSGITWHTGRAERAPAGVGLHTDFTLAPVAAAQVMAALIHRDRSGEGQLLEVSQYEAAIHLLDTQLLEVLVNGAEPARRGNRSLHYAPHGVFPCRGDDRWIAIVARDTADWRQLCSVMGRADLAERADLQDLDGRRGAEDEIETAISEWSVAHDAGEVGERLQRCGVPASRLQDMDDIVNRDAGMRDFFFRYEHEGVEFRVQHQPFTWDGQRLPTRRSPFLGEHNTQVLIHEFALSDERFAALVRERVIA